MSISRKLRAKGTKKAEMQKRLLGNIILPAPIIQIDKSKEPEIEIDMPPLPEKGTRKG